MAPTLSPFAQVGSVLARGAPDMIIPDNHLAELLTEAYRNLRPAREVLLVPPDGTRPDAHAPFLLRHALSQFERAEKRIIPALGTHRPMTAEAIRAFFGADAPVELFQAHDAQRGTFLAGTIDAETVHRLTGGISAKEFPVHVNSHLLGASRIVLAFSHIIPHEVMGMAGYTKHLCVGLGGVPTIDRSHEIAALYGIDQTLGRIDTPSRRLINHAQAQFLKNCNIVYVMLVRGPAQEHEVSQADAHGMVTRGVFVGNGDELFRQAAALSRQVNITVVEPLKEAVVFLPPENYHAFWVAMKGCYRLRLAMQEGGTLHVVCPGVTKFGENDRQEDLISRFGYRGWAALKELYDRTPELQEYSGIWAHLTHGSPPETAPGKPKFNLVVYPGQGSGALTRDAVVAANLEWGDHTRVLAQFGLTPTSPVGMHNGVYFAGNPAKGLWLTREALAALD